MLLFVSRRSYRSSAACVCHITARQETPHRRKKQLAGCRDAEEEEAGTRRMKQIAKHACPSVSSCSPSPTLSAIWWVIMQPSPPTTSKCCPHRSRCTTHQLSIPSILLLLLPVMYYYSKYRRDYILDYNNIHLSIRRLDTRVRRCISSSSYNIFCAHLAKKTIPIRAPVFFHVVSKSLVVTDHIYIPVSG